jgi:hypothetical protein
MLRALAIAVLTTAAVIVAGGAAAAVFDDDVAFWIGAAAGLSLSLFLTKVLLCVSLRRVWFVWLCQTAALAGSLTLIAALLLPGLIGAADKTPLLRTLANMRDIGNAMTAWQLERSFDEGGVAGDVAPVAPQQGEEVAAGRWAAGEVAIVQVEELQQLLVPDHLGVLPEKDGWGHPFEFRLERVDATRSRLMSIRSPGRDGTFSGDAYVPGAFAPTDYDQDIVWADGEFVRWPGGLGITREPSLTP